MNRNGQRKVFAWLMENLWIKQCEFALFPLTTQHTRTRWYRTCTLSAHFSQCDPMYSIRAMAKLHPRTMFRRLAAPTLRVNKKSGKTWKIKRISMCGVTIENVEPKWTWSRSHHGNMGTNGIRVDQIKRTSAWPISCDVAIERGSLARSIESWNGQQIKVKTKCCADIRKLLHEAVQRLCSQSRCNKSNSHALRVRNWICSRAAKAKWKVETLKNQVENQRHKMCTLN